MAIEQIRGARRNVMAAPSTKDTRISMAKTSRRRNRSKPGGAWKWIALFVLAAIVAAWYAYRVPVSGYSSAATAYTARVACSCHFVGGRELGDCAKDKISGMEMVILSADEEAKSVTASIPLVKSDTATYREGYGCVLQEWQG